MSLNPATFTALKLTMRWNDGYVAWINGTQIGSFAAPGRWLTIPRPRNRTPRARRS